MNLKWLLRCGVLPIGIGMLFLLFAHETKACGYAYVSDCATTIDLEINGATTSCQVSTCPYLTVFHNHNFGSVNSFSIVKAKSQTWESCDNNVMNARLRWRIYLQSATPGTFNSLNLTQLTTLVNGPYRTKTREVSPNLDLLAGLNPGSYFLEIYFESDVDFDNNGMANTQLLVNNGGNFYRASFIVPTNSGGSLNVQLVSKTNVTCPGGNNGSASVQCTNGSPPVSYAWSNGATAANLSGLAAGIYIVTATDNGGNTGTLSVNISQPAALLANVAGVNETSAPANNGSATASPSGGTPGYTFFWSNGATTASIANLNSGSYGVTVGDANGCTTTGSVLIGVSGGTPANYCASKGNEPWIDWITRVSLGSINQTSGKSQYSNFTSISTDLATGSSHAITLENGFSWQTFNEYWRVWIDYNRNGNFEEPGEIAFSTILNAPPLGAPGGSVSGTVTVPFAADEGLTRMRVSLKRGSYATPCETIPFGEVEDYTINIVNGGPPVCSLTSGVSNVVCSDNGTPASSADDTYTFSLTVNGSATGAGWQATIGGQSQAGNYGVAKTIGPLAIGAGVQNFTIADADSAACTVSQSVTPPATCSNPIVCNINYSVSGMACNDNGTPTNPADDTYSFNLMVTGTGTGSGWTATVLGSTVTGNYGQVKLLGPYAISVGNSSFTVRDAANTSCLVAVVVTPPAPCSNGGGGAGYCTSKGDFPWHDWIAGVNFGGVDNPSGKNQYSNFTSQTAVVSLGSSFPVALTAGFSWYTYDEHWKVWIDYDHDGSFEEPDELAFSFTQTAPPNGTLTATVNGTINIPNTTLPGNTRMRIAMKRGAAPSPCETLPFGEVEDYTVNIGSTFSEGTGDRSLALQLDAVPDLEAVELYAVLEITPGAAGWRLEKSTDERSFEALFSGEFERSTGDYFILEETDRSPTVGENFYRLVLLDVAGEAISQVQTSATVQPIAGFEVFPNPTSGDFFIEMSAWLGNDVRVEVFNHIGLAVHREVISAASEPLHRVGTAGWQDGIYFVLVQDRDRMKWCKRLILSR